MTSLLPTVYYIPPSQWVIINAGKGNYYSQQLNNHLFIIYGLAGENNMWLAGLVSLLQMAFLPGLIACSMIGVRGCIRRPVLSFACSGLINYLLVIILIHLGLFTIPIMRSMVVAEFVLLLFLYRKTLIFIAYPFPTICIFPQTGRGFHDIFRLRTFNRIGGALLVMMAACSLFFCFYYVFTKLGTIFSDWDAVCAWNRWASTFWYKGQIPYVAGYYPQLIPANWAMGYMVAGTDQIQFFTKGYTSLYLISTGVLLLDLAIIQRRLIYLLALPVMFLFLFTIYDKAHYGGFLVSGYVDMPVCFYTFSTFYCMICMHSSLQNSSNKEWRAFWILGILCAGAASLTKQSGIVIAIIYPLFTWLMLWRHMQSSGGRKWQGCLFGWGTILGILLLAGTWYMPVLVDVYHGDKSTNLVYLITTMHKESNPLLRLVYAITLIAKQIAAGWGGYAAVFFVFCMMLFALLSFLGRLTFACCMVYFSLWALGFSYDLRNLCTAIPLAALTFSYGISNIVGCIQGFPPPSIFTGKTRTATLPGPGIYTVLFIIIATAFWPFFTDDFLTHRQMELQKMIGMPHINTLIYEAYEKEPFSGKIWSHYGLLQALPGMKEYYLYGDLGSFEQYEEIMSRDDVRYALFPMVEHAAFDRRIRDDVRNKILEDKYTVLFDRYDWIMVKKTEEMETTKDGDDPNNADCISPGL